MLPRERGSVTSPASMIGELFEILDSADSDTEKGSRRLQVRGFSAQLALPILDQVHFDGDCNHSYFFFELLEALGSAGRGASGGSGEEAGHGDSSKSCRCLSVVQHSCDAWVRTTPRLVQPKLGCC